MAASFARQTSSFTTNCALPANYSFQWSGEYEFELRAKQRLQLILPVVFFVIFLLLYLVFHSVAEALVLIFPTIYAMTGGLLLQWLLGYNFSVAVAVGYIALFGIAVETGVVMVVYLHEALEHKLQSGKTVDECRHGSGGHRRRGAASAAKADDGLRRACQPCSDSLGIRHRLRCDEADRCAHRRRHDYFDHPRPDSGARLLRHDEGASVETRNACSAGHVGVTGYISIVGGI